MSNRGALVSLHLVLLGGPGMLALVLGIGIGCGALRSLWFWVGRPWRITSPHFVAHARLGKLADWKSLALEEHFLGNGLFPSWKL